MSELHDRWDGAGRSDGWDESEGRGQSWPNIPARRDGLRLAGGSGRLRGMKRLFFCLGFLCLTGLEGAAAAGEPYGLPDGLYAEITTTRGVVVCELYFTKPPMTVASYVGLAEGTLGPQPRQPFFDGSAYHRVVADFVAQGGAAPGGGEGPGYSFPDEFVPGLRHDSAGVLQMANDGPDSNGSQHCLMLSEQERLNYLHTVFGHVVRGLEVLPKIQQGDRMMTVKILRLGPAAMAFRADEAAFREMVAKAPRYSGPRRPGAGTLRSMTRTRCCQPIFRARCILITS